MGASRISQVLYESSAAVTEVPSPPTSAAAREGPVVLVVDDDPSLREALRSLLRSVGLRVELFDSAPAFLQSNPTAAAACLILDIRLPGPSGFDLQAELADEDIRIPIIFITAPCRRADVGESHEGRCHRLSD